jgi:hypothetical protein
MGCRLRVHQPTDTSQQQAKNVLGREKNNDNKKQKQEESNEMPINTSVRTGV